MLQSNWLPITVLALLTIFSSCQKEPIASFTVSSTSVNVDEIVSFSNTSIDAYRYEWDFGDGSTATYSSPKHTYNTAGTYTVTLTAFSKNGKKSGKATETIKVGGGGGGGDDCTNPETISGISGSINYTTTGYNSDYSSSCGGSGEDKVYSLSTAVSNGYTLTFWTTSDNYDVVLSGKYGSCTGTEIACVNDPDGTVLTWVNNTGSSQNVWFWVDGYAGSDGSATLNWNISL